eukprot:scaffold16103_cov78-Skeletonema_dohrnii-CCMP3373.AAC.1
MRVWTWDEKSSRLRWNVVWQNLSPSKNVNTERLIGQHSSMVIHLRLGNFDAAASLSKSTNDSHLGRASNHLACADAPSGVVLTFFFDGAMVDRWMR